MRSNSDRLIAAAGTITCVAIVLVGGVNYDAAHRSVMRPHPPVSRNLVTTTTSRTVGQETKQQTSASGVTETSTATPSAAEVVVFVVPNLSLHPGVTNPNVTQENISATICMQGWADTAQPPSSYTDDLKAQQLTAEHLTGTVRDYDEDHLISIELGGHPTDPRNLWPEPWENRGGRLVGGGSGAESKDAVESKLHDEVCAGQRQLADAQQVIAGWHPGLVVS